MDWEYEWEDKKILSTKGQNVKGKVIKDMKYTLLLVGVRSLQTETDIKDKEKRNTKNKILRYKGKKIEYKTKERERK